LTLNATVLVQMAHLLIAYFIMYHIFIKYALQLLIDRRLKEQSLEQSIALSQREVLDAEQQLKQTRIFLQQRLLENMPQEDERLPRVSANAGIERVQPSATELKDLAHELSKRLEGEVLS
jgi:hypothetical protein